jgi:hypothetical protein
MRISYFFNGIRSSIGLEFELHNVKDAHLAGYCMRLGPHVPDRE